MPFIKPTFWIQCFLKINFKSRSWNCWKSKNWNQLTLVPEFLSGVSTGKRNTETRVESATTNISKKELLFLPVLDKVGFINGNQIQPLLISSICQHGSPSATSQKRIRRPKHDLIYHINRSQLLFNAFVILLVADISCFYTNWRVKSDLVLQSEFSGNI